jgi:hypothetical protein
MTFDGNNIISSSGGDIPQEDLNLKQDKSISGTNITTYLW